MHNGLDNVPVVTPREFGSHSCPPKTLRTHLLIPISHSHTIAVNLILKGDETLGDFCVEFP
jgi:hypothetical protein